VAIGAKSRALKEQTTELRREHPRSCIRHERKETAHFVSRDTTISMGATLHAESSFQLTLRAISNRDRIL
jgi:hypothetical protein